MIIFETDKKPLTYFLDQIENRDLALPDFQRSFVWDPNATRELVVSIIRSFPAGTLLLMQGGANVFAPRAIEQAPPLSGAPSCLVLDGQQRMTSLYQAFSGKGSHRYFLNLQELIDGYDLDEAVEVYNQRRAKRGGRPRTASRRHACASARRYDAGKVGRAHRGRPGTCVSARVQREGAHRPQVQRRPA